LVVASDPRLQKESSDFSVAVLQRIHARRSDLEQERAQLSAEHGPNFPRVVEIGRQLQDLGAQKKAEDARLLERFRSAWQTATAREQMVRQSLDQVVSTGMKLNKAAAEYERMKLEVDSSHELYVRVLDKSQEAGLAAGVRNSSIAVVDPAFPPARPTSPDPLLSFAITGFVGLWVALGTVLLVESGQKTSGRVLAILVVIGLISVGLHAQAPTPSTSGLPAGVARIAPSQDTRVAPNPGEAPQVWNSPSMNAASAPQSGMQFGAPMPALIGPNDLLDITEYHTPEFHSAVRVSSAGTITLPMIEEVRIAGLDEKQAAREIEARLVARGMLLHPLVSVLVTSYSGQDVSILGEVARPGVYPYTVHHRLLDLISAASGLSQSAGRLVNIFHREDPRTAHPVVLDPGGTDNSAEHNPELKPGDTVQVSRAGLVYVIGDVIRPGGFPVDPAQGLTVVQALSLAWGPSQNAASTRALLIREQNGGRTMTALNLKRMLRGQEPDQPIHDRDILFVPDSTAHSIWNRTMESAIQSAIGVSIYSGLVYSQRY
jgi:polysaccharide export outer membrane protein